jgi:hypothetical protein
LHKADYKIIENVNLRILQGTPRTKLIDAA